MKERTKTIINKQKQKLKTHHHSPLYLPNRSTRKFDRRKLAKAAIDSVASSTNDAVTFSGGTMFPTQQSEPKEEIENVGFGSEKGKKLQKR